METFIGRNAADMRSATGERVEWQPASAILRNKFRRHRVVLGIEQTL